MREDGSTRLKLLCKGVRKCHTVLLEPKNFIYHSKGEVLVVPGATTSFFSVKCQESFEFLSDP